MACHLAEGVHTVQQVDGLILSAYLSYLTVPILLDAQRLLLKYRCLAFIWNGSYDIDGPLLIGERVIEEFRVLDLRQLAIFAFLESFCPLLSIFRKLYIFLQNY